MVKYLVFASAFVFSSWTLASGSSHVPKEWTVMVFVNGHNNLSPFAAKDLNEMEMVGSTASVNVVTQWASMENTTTKRMLIQKDQDPVNVTSPTLQELPTVDMGDYHSLVSFVEWSVQRFPAHKYMIVIWNHGMGWHGVPEDSFQTLDISSDDISGHAINTPQLGLAMDQAAKIIGHKVDIYGSDACSMASLEVATELKDSVQYFLGSEELEASEGWDYSLFLKALTSNPTSDGLQTAKMVADSYLQANPDGGEMGGITYSVVDTSRLDALLKEISELGKQIQTLNEDDMSEVWEAGNMAQRFWYDDDYRDLGDFVNNLEILTRDPEGSVNIQRASIVQMKSLVSKAIVYNVHSPKYFNANGLTIWLPLTKTLFNLYEKDYSALKFQALTDWGSALKKMAKK